MGGGNCVLVGGKKFFFSIACKAAFESSSSKHHISAPGEQGSFDSQWVALLISQGCEVQKYGNGDTMYVICWFLVFVCSNVVLLGTDFWPFFTIIYYM